MKRTILLIIILSSIVAAQEAQVDRLSAALDSVGFIRTDLGFQPKGYWNRFPQPDGIPHIMPFFVDLFSEPLHTIEYTQAMGNAVRQYLQPSFYDTTQISLHRLTYILGVDRMMTGFRNYSVNLAPRVDSINPMMDAFGQIYLASGSQLNFMAFGAQSDWPNYKKELEKKTAEIPYDLQLIIAELMLNTYDAYNWRQIAIRNISTDDALALFAIKDLAESIGDGQIYYPEIDDIAASLDKHSLYYSCMKSAQAAETASKKLKFNIVQNAPQLKNINFDFLSPIGRIAVGGTENNTHPFNDYAILIDLGGDDTYSGAAAGITTLQYPISIAIDISGNDTYTMENPSTPSQGSGILGAGILIDNSGDDRYQAVKMAQGCGFFGLGILLDVTGNDNYKLETSGQGCGYFGIGMNFDISGNDSRYLFGDGQGMGGVGGVGICGDYAGNDKYTAEPLESIAHRGDYHSENKINVNGAQGAGMGRRGDGSDGHSWAGGLGVLIDIFGDDHYYSGNWTLGCGYWFGTGLVYEGGGNDIFESVYFTQASGAHYCIGAIIDEGGDDIHKLWETAGAGIAFGWDYTAAILLDKGGNDRYEAKIISIANAQIRSDALLIDIGGDDYYQLQSGTQGFGSATFLDTYANPNKISPMDFYSKSFALLLDIGGKDIYSDWEKEKDKIAPNSICGDNKTWLLPSRDDKDFGHNNFGVGMDVEAGSVPEADFFR